MATCKTTTIKEYTVVLTLSYGEATCLMDLMQNPLTDDDPPELTSCREAIFNSLRTQIQPGF